MYITIGEKQEITIRVYIDTFNGKIWYNLKVNELNLRERIFGNKEIKERTGSLNPNIREFIFWLNKTIRDLIKFLTTKSKEKIKIEFKINNIPYVYYITLKKNKNKLKEYEDFLTEMTYIFIEDFITDLARYTRI
ncbi:MAG: hypothetical protein ACPL1F_07795 [bacterium]